MRFSPGPGAALLVASALLAGCGAGSSPAPALVGGPASPVVTPSPTASVGFAGDSRRVRVPGHGLAFEVPVSWFEVDPREALEAGPDDDGLEELAGRLGVTGEEFRAGLSEMVRLMVFSGDGAQRGFLDNVNVVVLPVRALPSDATVRLELGAMAARDVEFRRHLSPEGRRLLVSYRLTVGTLEVEGRGLFVDLGDEVVQVTVTALEAGQADQLMELIDRTTIVLSDGPGA